MERRMIKEELAWNSPLAAFAPLAGCAHAHLLHAGEHAANSGWSILVAHPSRLLSVQAGRTLLDGDDVTATPFEALRALHRERSVLRKLCDVGAPFFTGLVGYVGYEMGAVLEPTAQGPVSPFALPDMNFAAYDAAVLFDNANERAFLCAHDEGAAEALKSSLVDARDPVKASAPQFDRLRSNFSAESYQAAVAEIVERIRDGEFFQANLSQRLEARTKDPVSAVESFGSIVKQSDALFCALLQYREGTVISNSPERLFSISAIGDGRWRILAEPIKGTRPRGVDTQSDEAFASELLSDPKDRAENIMITDLTRNDLSRICCNGSVKEEEICALLPLARVYHLVSRVGGVLRDGLDPIDALTALFPCGSVTGAPKVQAMKAISEFEGVGRGPYCGAIGYIGDDGVAEFSVAIRTMIIENKGANTQIVCPVGGGVTLRSDPQAEYEETLLKAQTMLKILGFQEDARP